ncbi:hypothetical protein CONPUDRAFT_81586 [Coniophora puteana RWD-64-598 SS2]|uniref:Uncharacterized protein n=1 Tax=Coniophora puteana (strain RWD-64-598) TaxID=741705 RepID=A0A5M3MS92_CONPW|nr:uncharacterized protein CONPUDRAFT_81586 [Coniophora puteana RWD-64-598 SS2]EIW81947.1 hypothetical protein CONPUDRAFT_81586 [Coniophora puteana RWD-64-598 SS2]
MQTFSRLAVIAGALTVASAQFLPQSCYSLTAQCNYVDADLSDVWGNVACTQYALCAQNYKTPVEIIGLLGASANQPKLSQDVFANITGGDPLLTAENYAVNYEKAVARAGGTYTASDNALVEEQYRIIAGWTNKCDGGISYDDLADWLANSAKPGVCPKVTSCDGKFAAVDTPCGTQPDGENGSCAAVNAQCELWVTGGAWKNEYCVLGALCYSAASATPDVMLRNVYPTYVNDTLIPTAGTIGRLPLDVFQKMTGGADTMTLQNAVDAYYNALTNVYASAGGPFGAQTPVRSGNNGPYPNTPTYINQFWSLIAAWTGNCDTMAVSYSQLADYLQFSSTSDYHPTC